MVIETKAALTQTVAPPAMATRRLGHANIYVNELSRSYKFYNMVCGFECIGREDSIKAVFLSNGNTHHDFALVESDGAARVGMDNQRQDCDNYEGRAALNHIGWETVNQKELIEAYRRGLEWGLEVKMSLFHGGSYALYLFDPDGNLHEFYADARKDWRTIFTGPVNLGLVSRQWNPLDDAENPMTDENWDPAPEWRHQDGGLVEARRAARTVFYVTDVRKLLGFYQDVAGLEALFVAPDYSYAYLGGNARQGPFDIALLECGPDGENRPGYHHIACEVADEAVLEASIRRLEQQGQPILRQVDDAQKRSFFLEDPDGLKLEFFVDRAADYSALGKVDPHLRPFFA